MKLVLARMPAAILVAAFFMTGAPSLAQDRPSAQAPAKSAMGVKTSNEDKSETAEERPGILPVARPGFGSTPEAGSFASVCPTVRMQNRNDFDFTPMEERLLCGDPTPDNIGLPWARIPPNQAAYFLKGFLQNRGFHQMEMIQDGDVLFVKTGPQSRLEKFRILGGPATWDPPRRRLIKGLPLTPGLLDDLQGWALSQIKNEGYACATADVRADPVTGEALVEMKPGEIKYITGLESTGDTGLRDGVLDRYNAFRVGDLYRERLITLTKKRTQDDGFLQTLILSARCEPDGVKIVRDVILGPSRTVRIGVGGSTDEGARLRAIIRQNRIGSSASSAQARANVSWKNEKINRQVLESSFRWYYARGEARSFLEPQVSYENARENVYEARTTRLNVTHGWNHEYESGQMELKAGPSFLLSRQSSPLGPLESDILIAEGSARWMHHDYEFFGTSPRTGEYLESAMLATQRSWGANFTAQKLQVSGQKLWNIFRFDPPLLILATRFNVSTVFSPDENITADLPVQFLTFLGGDTDLRGFERQSLPRSGVGALSGASVSVEGRLHKVIFRRADVFTFLDTGKLGRAQLQLEDPLFMSPGLGLRWESPIGVLRGYGAQRFAINEKLEEPYPKEWRLGFTFGEEF